MFTTYNTEYGTLYIVSTPIGNFRDLSPRAIEILSTVDMIAAEDTRRTIILLNKIGIRNQLVSNHNYNEYNRVRYFIDQLKEGKNIAIVTDAGTPCISDPGNALIKTAIQEDIRILGVPGCCAAINALVVSGFDLSSFLFYGFFPRENGERMKLLRKMRRETITRTYVFYESPKRILSTVSFFADNDAGCQMSLSNDMTKPYERTYRGTPAEVRDMLLENEHYDKGEYVLNVEVDREYLITETEHTVSPEALLTEMMVTNNCSVKEAIKLALAEETNTYSKNELYAASIRLKELF